MQTERTRPKKRLGQHFLSNTRVASRIVEAVSPGPHDLVFEIGPGRGALTRLLVARGCYVVAVEIDLHLAAELERSLQVQNLHLLRADVLSVDWMELIEAGIRDWGRFAGSGTLGAPRVRVVANLPYYISTPVIQKLLRVVKDLFDMTLMLQEEVVERITSDPGSREYGFLSVLVQYHCEVKKLFRVAPSSFDPPPKVWSAVMRLMPRRSRSMSVADEEEFFRLVKAAFSHRRKTILNNLKSAEGLFRKDSIQAALESAGIDPARRSETLSLAEFVRLDEALRSVA